VWRILVRQSSISVALVALLGALVLWAPQLLSVNSPVPDLLLRVAAAWSPPPPEQLPDVVVVAIDGKSLRTYRDWPWPRDRYAELIRRLDRSGARAIAFDIDFSTPRNPETDRAFAEAIAESGHVVLGVFRQFEQVAGLGELETAGFPAAPIAAAGTRLGATNFPLDADGTVRRGHRGLQIVERLVPSLPLALLEAGTGSAPEPSPGAAFPLDYRRVNPPIRVLSVADVLAGRYAPSDIRGRVVFVGATAPILQDVWPTPLAPVVPGVMIQALQYRHHAAEQAGEPVLAQVTPPWHVGLIVLLALAGRLFGARSARERALATLVQVGAVACASPALLIATGYLIDPTALLIAIGAQYVLGTERIRSQISRRLADRERSLASLASVARVASDPFGPGGLKRSLRLLGLGSSAQSLSLLALDEEGHFEDEPLEWTREGEAPRPDLRLAHRVAASRRIELVTASAGAAIGPAHQLYVPLIAGAQPVGVLIAAHDPAAQPGEFEVSTTAAVATLIALAMANDRLIRKLREALARTESASRAKSEFLANMSHEIRTPMTAVLGYLELLSDPDTPAEQHPDLITAMRRNGTHLLNVLNDILDLSQIEAGGLPIRLVACSPAELCSEMETFFRGRAEEKGLRFELDLSPSLPDAIDTDPVRVRQILLNLIGNAIKFTDTGFVRLSAALSEGQLRFEVLDSGVGMDAETRRMIFERFTQADGSSTRAHGGSGLGLAIVRELAERLGGSVDVESSPGEGSAFRVTLPFTPPMTAPSTPPEPTAPSSRLSGRVLVAEDSVDNQRLISLFLGKAGLDVDIAENGAVACELAQGRLEAGAPYDLIFMDVDMPVRDGYEATRALRAAGYTGPIIALTAHALAGDRERCIEAGCDDYLTKPIARQQLVEVATAHLAKRELCSEDCVSPR
jgi:signal transduction histidine kinase/CheY-like chemotaxis protein